ncbi:hypothetical protein C5167_009188 [Papaver somniferum]|uniref:Uncharacterized protein n=1 Tax=Papaver somniferum TaxID=3469 RepID=A0A4Y7JZL2_PAPSO|nr:glycine-rich protein 5-like [Papaver somniferum]RZC65500.1 hypothetical protein C5167_009188 [Papaver somniferum]
MQTTKSIACLWFIIISSYLDICLALPRHMKSFSGGNQRTTFKGNTQLNIIIKPGGGIGGGGSGGGVSGGGIILGSGTSGSGSGIGIGTGSTGAIQGTGGSANGGRGGVSSGGRGNVRGVLPKKRLKLQP